MTPETSPVQKLPAEARRVVHKASPILEKLARVGFVARGTLYVIIGVLAVQAALGSGGDTTDGRGALQEILRAPFGTVLLVAAAIAFFGYAAWRLVEAVLNYGHGDKHGLKAVIRRIGYGVSAVLHALLGATAIQLVNGTPPPSGEQSSKHWTARIMAQPFGLWIVGIVGAIVIGVGIWNIRRAIKGSFKRDLAVAEMSDAERSWTNVVGRVGLAAQGIVLDVVGLFLIVAAIEENPRRAHGLGGALSELATSPFGPILLGVVAVGLMAFGVYCFVEARYRRIPA